MHLTERTLRAPLTLSLEGRTLAQQDVELGVHDRRVLIFHYDGPPEGRLLARLDIADDLPRTICLPRAPRPRAAPALYVGPGNPYLSRLLGLFPRALEQRAALGSRNGPGKTPYDVVIFDRVAAPALAQGNFILINAVAPNLPLELKGKMQNPRVNVAAASHPLTEGLNLSDLTVSEASRVALKGDGAVLARAGESPLLYALDRASSRRCSSR